MKLLFSAIYDSISTRSGGPVFFNPTSMYVLLEEVIMAASKRKLIIVESPAKARTISRFLGSSYKVEASQGHVRDLPKSQLGVDVDHDFDLKYITIRGRGDIISTIKKEAKNASKIYLATDPDREGEAISWHLAHILGLDTKSPCRIEFHEVTKSAVQDAIKHPRVIDMDLVDAQQARRVLDRLVGYQISPILWAKVKKGLSAGRVQSVVTRMVVDRENEIDAFIPEEYWEIKADALIDGQKKPIQVSLSSINDTKVSLHCSEEAEKAADLVRQAKYTVTSVKKSERRRFPAPPFTTSSLQQEASRKLGFSTAKTMQVVQQLYEGIDIEGEGTQGIVTYIRTDSVRVSDEALSAIRAFIPDHFGKEYLPDTPNVFKGRKNAQDAHEAIRPTDIRRTPDSIKNSLSKDQYHLYRLIYNRTIASQMTQAVYETLAADMTGNGTVLHFYGEHRVFQGFTLVYEDGKDEEEPSSESRIPLIHEGSEVSIENIETQQHFTQPPARYTEASLVHAMEEKGIGRPSTYAPTITTIITRGYISREKKRLYPTELGKMVTSMMEQCFSEIVDVDFTASLEDRLDHVEDGTTEWKSILRDFYPEFQEELNKAETDIEKVEIKDEPSDVICDQCGATMVYKMGRYGRFLACPNFPACRNTKPILNYIDTRCPKCGSRLLEKISKKNRKFYGCEKYPECDFVSWEKPVPESCPKCGSYMVEKRGKHHDLWYLCSNETCRFRKEMKDMDTESEEV